ncbi:MAG: hypothetical protein IKY67_04980 [Paludibacteraceae bacterium]|nr:hypothetical protein [Paludibacteraceae bacterium]
MSLMDLLQDMLPDSWFNDVRMNYGDTLTDEMIVNSVQQASDFFNIDNPMAIAEDWTTGVYPNMDVSPIDDVLIFNREQLVGMGITEQEGLDLVMTHECAHRALQGMSHLGFDSHQEELCCDFMAGVRAGLNGIDVSQMENSLVDTPVSDTHPGGADRVDSIEEGVEFAREYYATYGIAPTFRDCLAYFKGDADLADLAPDGQITLRPEHSAPVLVAYESCESLGSVAFVDGDLDERNPSFKGYTQDEINRKMAKAEKEKRYYEGLVRHHQSMAKDGLGKADTEYHLHQADVFQKRANEYKEEYQKWKWTKPDKK